jgi:hypothetical protein
MHKTFNKFINSSFCRDDRCVEVAITTSEVLIRQSSGCEKSLRFTLAEWSDFILGVKNGEFDIMHMPKE